MNRAILVFSGAALLWLAMVAPLAAFDVNPDGTVTDPATGLMWDRCSWGQIGANCSEGSASLHNWQAALGIAVAANTANHRGYSDWRLPNRTELESLVDITRSGPAINMTAFPDTPSSFFWSSTVFTPNPGGAWVVNFGSGGAGAGIQANGVHVRLVRSGQSFDALPPATQIAMITQPSSTAQSGGVFTQQPEVEVRDANGNPVTLAGTNVTAAIASGGGSLTGTTTVATDANGQASFTDLAISGSVGDRTLSFSSGSLTAATSDTISLSAGPATQMAINAGDGQSAVAGQAVAVAPSVIVRDANNNPVAGVAVTFTVSTGGGSVTGGSATSNASGIAMVGSWTLGNTAGSNTLIATSTGLIGSPLSFTATGTSGPAIQMAINAGDGQSAVVGQAVTVAPSVLVRDVNNNPVAGVAVSFAVATGGGSVTDASAISNASGIATVGSWTLGTTAGSNTLTATSPGLTGSPLTFTATGTAGTATQMSINAGDGQSAVAGQAVAVAPSVLVRDVNNNPVAGVAVTFAVATGGGSVTDASAISNSSGIATVGSWTLGSSAGSNTLTATSPGLTGSPLTFTATGTAGTATQIAINAGDGQSAVAGQPVAVAPSVVVRDANNNPVEGVAVTFAVASGGGSLTGGSATSNASGIATVGSWTLGTTAGSNTLTASSPGLTGSPLTFSATGTAGTATQMAINAGDGQSAVAGQAVAVAPSVIVRDANNNPVAGVAVTFAVATGGGSLTGASATTNASGIATVGSWTLGTTAGSNTLTATADGIAAPVTFTATGTAGAATQMAINAGDGQSAVAGQAVAVAPSVVVRDANDNPVEGVEVNFAVATGGGSLTGASATTNASGIATVGSWTLGTTAGSNTLTATSPGLTGSPLSFTATATAGTATQMAINAGDGQSAVAGAAVAVAPSVLVRDANNNPVEGVAVTFAVASGGGSVTGGSATSNASGIATVGSWTLGTTAGSNTLTATAAGIADPVTFTATGSAGTASQMAIQAGQGQSATGGTAVAIAPSVLVTDANNNPVEGVAVTFAVASGGGTVDPTTAVSTGANGIAAVTSWTLGTTAGENTLSATAAGIAETVTFTATGKTVPAAPTDVSAAAGNAEATVSWSVPSDTGGLPITGYTVTAAPGGQTCTTAGETSCTVTGLSNGTEYTFTVIASNAEGDSPPSSASASVTPIGSPGGPVQVRVQPSPLSLIVSWVAPSDNGGSPILTYRAEANPGCEVTALADEVPGVTAYSCTIFNLDAEQEYTVTVTAINAAGEGPAVAAAAARPLQQPIPIPTLGAWSLLLLMLLMLAIALPRLARRERV